MFNKFMLAGASALALTAAHSAANATTINFDTITTGDAVNSYYAGGTDSSGQTGPNYGVTFTTGDWTTQTKLGETSQPNLAYSRSGSGVINFANGASSISFNYGSFKVSRMSVYSGLNGTGTLLANVPLPADDVFAESHVSLPFSGIAKSVVLSASAAQFAFDDLTFDAAVPEPATWAMMLTGFGLVGFAMRKRASLRVSYAPA